MGVDGALLRDPRATERKKTGLAGARKRVSGIGIVAGRKLIQSRSILGSSDDGMAVYGAHPQCIFCGSPLFDCTLLGSSAAYRHLGGPRWPLDGGYSESCREQDGIRPLSSDLADEQPRLYWHHDTIHLLSSFSANADLSNTKKDEV